MPTVSTATYLLLLTLPVWGMLLVLALASVLRGSVRRMTLTFAPLLVGFATWWVEPYVYGPSNDWLSTLFTAAVRGACWLGLLVYYACLLVTAIGGWLRHNEALRQAARDLAAADAKS